MVGARSTWNGLRSWVEINESSFRHFDHDAIFDDEIDPVWIVVHCHGKGAAVLFDHPAGVVVFSGLGEGVFLGESQIVTVG